MFAVDSIGPQEQEPFQVREVVGGHRIEGVGPKHKVAHIVSL